jgi:hypothetical protein
MASMSAAEGHNSVLLRQMKSQGHASPVLSAWLASFDSASPGENHDEAAFHHDG